MATTDMLILESQISTELDLLSAIATQLILDNDNQSVLNRELQVSSNIEEHLLVESILTLEYRNV